MNWLEKIDEWCGKDNEGYGLTIPNLIGIERKNGENEFGIDDLFSQINQKKLMKMKLSLVIVMN